MYERNINVLEMFVEKKLGYVETNNIQNNYYDYKEFVKVLDDYINICKEESKAKQEYDFAVTNIQNIQNTKEKLYNQNVKFEYSRNIIFGEVNRKVEDIEKCLVKIESALDKNKDAFKTLRKNFIEGIINLNEKNRQLKKISKPKNKIEAEYKEAFSLLKENFHSINPDDIELTKKFIESPSIFEEELIEKMMRNGKNEKVPFDKNAIISATKLGLDIAQKIAENYLFMYEQTGKILNELENDKLKIEARKKHITDTEVKLSFLNAEKEYLVQFLDNERVTAIQGPKEHDRLMKNCCNILKEDVNQINILYDLIIKETKKRATNRCYEELYNKSYLEKIQEKEKKFIEKTNNIDYANGTYGRKFVAPPENSEDQQPQIVERVVERVVNKVVEKPVEKIIERIIEKPVEIVPENPEFKELNNLIPQNVEDYDDDDDDDDEENKEYNTKINNTQDNLRKIYPKFRRIKRNNQIIDYEDEIEQDLEENQNNSSIYAKSKEQFEKSELEDIEAIIKEAKESITPKTKKSHIIKRIIKKKGKYAEE